MAKLPLLVTPLSHLGVREDWSELQIQSGAKVQPQEAQKQGHDPGTHPATFWLTPKAEPLFPQTLHLGSITKRMNPKDSRSLKILKTPQRSMYFMQKSKRNPYQPKQWCSNNPFEPRY